MVYHLPNKRIAPLLLLLLLLPVQLPAAERIVLLSPAAADIIDRLGAAEQVVGKTRSVREFPQAQKVGSHIRPNLEIIRSLNPDLLIISSNRFFSDEMAAAVGARVHYYHPATLEQILEQIRNLSLLLGREDEGLKLIAEQRQKLKQVQSLDRPPRVIYEVTAMPLMIAGSKNIVSDIIETAGGSHISGGKRKLVRFNNEAVLARQPAIYLYQVGPMNRNPTPPQQRGPLKSLQASYLQVDELQYSRANTRSFDNVLQLNRYFRNAVTSDW